VYRARDTRLNRIVAIKVLSKQVSAQPELRERFEREARTISSLQHPNICTLHDIGQQDGIDFLVLEYVEGEPLDQRIAKGPLPIDQVLRYAAEIGNALDKAHRQGIVHRDLKPGNVIITRSGAKLLDFGLAKLQEKSSALSAPPTDVTLATGKLTTEGTLVGTFQYMAPEQLEGKEADSRSDIFALGTVIYEMATGKPAFEGKSRASLIAAILSSEPQPISTITPMSPPALDRVLKRCLAKDPDDRWQNAGDLASELKWIAVGGSQSGVPAPVVAGRKHKHWIPWLLAAAFAGLAVLASLLYLTADRPPKRAIQAYLPPPVNTSYFFSGDSAGFPAISPQGDMVAFVAVNEQASRLLWIRSLTDGSVHSIPSTENAEFPFWSPDEKFVAFFTPGKIKRVSVSGGLPTEIADAPNPRGGSWGRDNVILFTPATQEAIYSVPASGGEPKKVTAVDLKRHTTNRWPYFLPDGKHFLYLAASHNKPHAELDEIYVASLDGKENRKLTTSTSNAIAVPGYLLFLQGTTLVAQAFDLDSATLRGDPIAVAQNVHFEEGNWHGVFDCSRDGTLIYQLSPGSQGSRLLWYARDGKVLSTLGDFDYYQELQLSRDGKRLVVSVGEPAGSLWIYDLARGVKARYTFSNNDRAPVWSPDNRQIVFMRTQASSANLFVVDSASAGTEHPLYSSSTLKFPSSWSPDGKTLLYTETPVGLGVSQLPLLADPKPQEFLPKVLTTSSATFSPNGHWVAYASQESGRSEVFVTQFPGPKGKWQISTAGGSEPVWRRDGKALFYWSADHTFNEAQLNIQGEQFQVTAIHPLFRASMPVVPAGSPTYDVSPDGQRFIVNSTPSGVEQPLTLVTNWTALLQHK
jgi:eukaryotic-like serine/threonine-protein kinase